MKKETIYIRIPIILMLLCGICFVFPLEVKSQESKQYQPKSDPSQITQPRLVWEKPIPENDSSSLFYRLIHPFQKARFLKEQKRIIELVEKYLKVDPTTADDISRELIRITSNQEYFNDNLWDQITIDSLKNDIREILAMYDDTAQKSSLDSIALLMENIIQGIKDDLNKDQVATKDEIRKKINEIRKFDFKYDSSISEKIYMKNDTVVFRLKSKKKVFGWHNGNLDKRVIEDYNFNYLTDIIYDGYELAPTGENKNEKLLNNLVKDKTLSAKAKQHGVPLSLSIFSDSFAEISAFLASDAAQFTLIDNILRLTNSGVINGINIYFENLPVGYKDQFTAFIHKIEISLLKPNKGFLLTVSLPAIAEMEDREITKAYDFEKLNRSIDYYLVQTDKLKFIGADIPGSPSPLLNLQDQYAGSIESTLDYYSNGKINLNKLVMTVTYLGLNWSIVDNSMYQSAKWLAQIGPINIRDYFNEPDQNHFRGYDYVQESPYINYHENGQTRQLWFEDGNSLYKKYNYALDQSLGGIAIWGLGTDDNNTELWNALGAAMFELDTINSSSDHKDIINKPSYFSYIHVAFSDLMWATPNDLNIGNPLDEDTEIKLDRDRFCLPDIFKKNKQLYDSYLKDSMKLTQFDIDTFMPKFDQPLEKQDSLMLLIKRKKAIGYLIKIYGEGKQIFNINNKKFVKIYSKGFSDWWYSDPKERYIDTPTHCTCLMIRWELYATILLCISMISFVVSILIYGFVFWKKLKVGDDKKAFPSKNIFEGLAIAIFIFGLIIFLGFLYFDIHFPYFGAASDEVPFWVLALILFFGFIFGIALQRMLMYRNFSKNNLP